MNGLIDWRFTPVAACVGFGLIATVAVAQTLPNGEGRDVVEKICAACHDLGPITDSVGGTRDDWNTVVQSMISMGADIKPEQVALITNYLAQNFPPKPAR